MNHNTLPHLTAPLALTDGGMETTLIFDDGFDLPYFASFVLLDSDDGRAALDRYVSSYTSIAAEHGVPLIIESPTWRASADWGRLMSLSDDELVDVNRRSVHFLADHADECELVISGCIGPRGDGYVADIAMDPAEAAAYHRPQVDALRDAGAHLVSALTMTNIDEAAGIAVAAREAGIACVISFTTETDGRLPSGEKLADAVSGVDELSEASPAYYMINCAHPTHFEDVLEAGPWMDRIRGIRSNSSTMSHEELDAAEELDAGDPVDLAARYASLRERFPNLSIFGGCCGTSTVHIAEAAAALTA